MEGVKKNRVQPTIIIEDGKLLEMPKNKLVKLRESSAAAGWGRTRSPKLHDRYIHYSALASV